MTECTSPCPSSDGVGCYPDELVDEVETTTGVAVHLRPIRSDDGRRLTEFHERLSPRSVYRRFFFMHSRLSAAEVERFTHVDYFDRMALVAEVDDRLVAVGRYERLPGTTDAEVAFIVSDDYQHRGIGSILLERLAVAGRKRGITAFVAQTLLENRAMLQLFMNSGFQVDTTTESGTTSVRFSIELEDGYRRASDGHFTARTARQGGSAACSWLPADT